MSYYNAINNKHRTALKEDKYFDAYVVTQANAASLQSLLDTHMHVRLDAGDYSAASGVTLSSNQSLYGWVAGSNIGGDVTISAGATNVHVENLKLAYTYDVIFEAGAEISNVTLKRVHNTIIRLTNGKIANCTFIDLFRVRAFLDCSTSGYIRNNIFLKWTTQSNHIMSTFDGNNAELSYGNVELWRNFLISHGDGGVYNNMYSHTLIGVDAESWNYNDLGSKGAIYMRGMGHVKIASINAYNNIAYDTLPALDIQANNLILYSTRIEDNQANLSVGRMNTNIGTFYSRDQVVPPQDGSTSFTLNGMSHLDAEVLVNGVNTTSEITGDDLVSTRKLIKTLEGDSIAFDNRKYLIEAAGANWATERVGKSDESVVIQALIDSDDVAVLEPRVYYISQPLVFQDGKGIVGQGMGKTIIIGITDDFNLIEHVQDTSGGDVTSVDYVLAHLTLQGGEKGFYVSKTGANRLQVTAPTFKDVLFKDQTHGIMFDQIYGFDNAFLENVGFDNCTIGFYQYPDPNYPGGDTPEMGYVDKVVFYNCYAYNCGMGFSMDAKRVNNTNMWVNCKFDNNTSNLDMNNNLNCLFVNCNFTNTQGTYVIEGGNVDVVAFYGCTFSNNAVTTSFHLRRIYMEDCTSTDEVDFILSAADRQVLLANCRVSGTLNDVDDGMLINSVIVGNAALSKELVRIDANVATTLIDNPSSPYPQILVTKKETSNVFNDVYNTVFN